MSHIVRNCFIGIMKKFKEISIKPLECRIGSLAWDITFIKQPYFFKGSLLL